MAERPIRDAVRAHPLVCGLVAGARLLQGRLRWDRSLVGKTIRTREGRCFEVFRHVSLVSFAGERRAEAPAVLIARFEFARLSQRANRLTSLLPIPAIAGHPGFRHKVWMVDGETGCWQGVYEWADERAAQAYERSFVFGVMGRRAKAGSLMTKLLPATTLEEFLSNHEC